MQSTADQTKPPFDFSKLKARWAREQAGTRAESARLRDQVRRVVPPILRRYGVTRAYLFGSVAEGRAGARSDVDLLVMGVAAAAYWNLRHDIVRTTWAATPGTPICCGACAWRSPAIARQ